MYAFISFDNFRVISHIVGFNYHSIGLFAQLVDCLPMFHPKYVFFCKYLYISILINFKWFILIYLTRFLVFSSSFDSHYQKNQ